MKREDCLINLFVVFEIKATSICIKYPRVANYDDIKKLI